MGIPEVPEVAVLEEEALGLEEDAVPTVEAKVPIRRGAWVLRGSLP